MRYKELYAGGGGGTGAAPEIPFEIDGYLTEIDTGKIDVDYMNTRFEKYLHVLGQKNVSEAEMQQTLDDVHKSFAYLTQDEQKYANIFLHDVECGYAVMEKGKTFRDYVTEYQSQAKNDEIRTLALNMGLDESKLRAIMNAGVSDANINEFGRFEALKATVDSAKAKAYFERREGSSLAPYVVNRKAYFLLRDFILKGGFAT
jgi:type I restriction enzyme R subunit